MVYSSPRIDELAAQVAMIEQMVAATLVSIQEELADLRAAVTTLLAIADEGSFNDARATGQGYDGECLGALMARFDALTNAYDSMPGLDPASLVTTYRAAVIRVPHTFDNETTPQAPFILGPNTSGQLVTGLNADTLDGQEGAYYANYANLSNKPTAIDIYTASAALTLTTALQDVAGLTTFGFTQSANEKALIIVAMTLDKTLGAAPCNNGDAIVNQLQVNGASVLAANITADSGAGSLAITRVYIAMLNAGTTYTIKVQSQNVTGNRGQMGAGSQMVVWRMGI